MSTNPQQPQGSPAPDDHFDDQTGVYGFFRRNQKKLLYTAGLFTLLTFSITGSLMDTFRKVFTGHQSVASIQVNGRRVDLTSEDYDFGERISRNDRSLPPGVLLPITSSLSGNSELGECYAILRRAAIEEGIGVSWVEVDRSIDTLRELRKLESAARLAQMSGFGSLAEFRQVVSEAMRIGTYVRLQTAALNIGDAEVLRQVLFDADKAKPREKVGFEVAVFDVEAHQKELAATEISDDDLRAWLDGKSEAEKRRLAVYDLPRVQLRLFAAVTAEGQFDASQWLETSLKDFAVTEDELRSYYEQDKDLRFALETAGEYRPFEDEAVQAELTRVLQAQRVMNDLLTQARNKQIELMKPATDEVAQKQEAFGAARDAHYAEEKAKSQKNTDIAAKEKELAEKPDDAELKAALETLRTELMQIEGRLQIAEPALQAAQAALDAAKEAQSQVRASFDLIATLTELTQGKSGFVTHAMTELKDAKGLEDLDALGFDLGKWSQSSAGAALQNAGDMCQGPARSNKAVFAYQATATEPKPLKAWDVLKPQLVDAYWIEKADAVGRDKQKAMQDALLRLAKERMPEFVAEKEAKRQERIDAKVTEWEEGVTRDMAQAQEMLARPNLGSLARNDWQAKLTTKTAEHGRKAMMVTNFTRQVGKEIDDEIAEEAKKHYGAVLATAAAEAGFAVSTLAPLPRDVTSQPRFADRFDATVRYVFKTHADLEQGEASAVSLGDSRRYVVAVCNSVAPLTIDDITRREFEGKKNGVFFPGYGRFTFAKTQMGNALQQSFLHEVLEKRYALERKRGTQTEPQ